VSRLASLASSCGRAVPRSRARRVGRSHPRRRKTVRSEGYSDRVTLETFERAPAEHLPPAAALAKLVAEDRLVLLPDQVIEVGDERIAGFRPESKALRVDALDARLEVDLVVPAGARAGEYTEHAADWVLPLILSVPGGAIGTLVANEIQRRLDAWRAARKQAPTPTARFREVVIDQDLQTLRQIEIEGPADELAEWLRSRSPGEPVPAAAELSEANDVPTRPSDP
jgi:hypothetical protein